MSNPSFSTVLLILAVVQMLMALFWIVTGRQRPLARWFSALVFLFGIANLLEGLATSSNLALLPRLAALHAFVTPLTYLTFLGGTLLLLRPQWGEGRIAKVMVGVTALVAALAAIDIFTKLGFYFTAPIARDSSLPLSFESYTSASPFASALGYVLPALGVTAALLLLFGLLRRMNVEQRAVQVVLLLAVVLAAPLSFFFGDLIPPMSTTNFTLTIGLFVVMAISTPNLLDRMGRIVANQPIPTKLSWGFGSLLIITLFVGLFSVYALILLNQRVQNTLSTQNRLAISANSLLDQYRQARRHERDFELQARTTGLDRALQGPYAQWLDSVKAMERTLTQLKREPLNPDQRNRVKTIESMYSTYLQDSENLFQGYRRRGDREVGSLADWLTATEVLDQQISSVSNNQPFNELFLSLRTQQAYYLISENSNRGNEIQDLYDEMQEFLLFSPEWDVPLGDRVTTQELLQEEAVAFSQVRESTRGLTILRFTLEGTSTVLEQYISEFSTQANTEFNAGVTEIERSRGFYSILIVVALAIGLVVAYLLSEIVTRQIRGPVLALVDAADQMASGKLNVRAEVLSRDELGVAANALNTMASRLQSLLGTLEERVAHRTAQLETAAQVAAAASEVRELTELLVSTTNLLVDHFEDVYHAQVFLVDQQGEGEWAVLRASTGEVGQMMLAQGHRLQVGSTSVIGKVTASGNYELARTTDPYSVHKPHPLLPDTKAELSLPMKRRGRVIGALDVQSTRHYAFTEDDVKVLQTLADQLAIAVENARLFRDLGGTIKETELLFQASSKIASSSNKEELLDIFIDVAGELREPDRLSVMLFDEFDADGRPVAIQSLRSWSEEEGGIQTLNRFNISQVMPVLWAALEQGTYAVENIAHLETLDPSIKQIFSELGTKSFAVVPLEAATHYLGVLLLQRRSDGPLSEEVLRIYRVLAQQAAVALNRFMLLEQLSERVNELQELRQGFLDLGSATTMDVLLRTLASRAKALVDSDASIIYLYDEKHEEMELVALDNLEQELMGSRLGAGEGAVGQIIISREPFIVDNYAMWQQGSEQFPERQRYGAVAAVPLLWQNRLLGALTTVNMRERRRFSQDDLRRLTLFADQAALTIENTRLLDETERSLKETETLYGSTQGLINASTEEEMVSAVVGAMGNDTSDVILFVQRTTEGEQTLLQIAERNDVALPDPTGEGHWINSKELFPTGQVLPAELLVSPGKKVWEAKGRIVSLTSNEISKEARGALPEGFQSMMSVPIYSREGLYGAILVLRRGEARFLEDELTRYGTVASQFAVAYDNIILLEESRRAATQLATAAEVSRAASTQLDVDKVLNRAVELIKEKFGYYHVQVFLVDEANLWAELKASTGEVGQELLSRKHRLGVGTRSVIGQVTATGHYVAARSEGAGGATVHRRNELLPDTQAELALPMKVGDTVLGALDVQSEDPFAFHDQGDIAILQTLADQLAVAVQNARLFERTQQTLQQSQALYQAGRAISGAESLEDILRAIQLYVAPSDTSDISIVTVHTDEEGNPSHLRVEAIIVPDRPQLKLAGRVHPISNEQYFLFNTLRGAREAIVIHDTTNDTRLDPKTRELYERLKVGALVAVPLVRIEGRQMLLQVSLPSARHVLPAEVERLGTIAAQAATAIENLFLLASLEERASRLGATNDLTSKMLQANNLDEMLRLAVQEITDIMDADQGGIIFFDLPNEIGHVVAQHRKEGPPPAIGSQISLKGNKSVEWLREHKRPLAITNVNTEPLVQDIIELLQAQGIKSILLIPLFVRGEMIGSVGLDMISRLRPWSDVDISLAQNISNLLASAIESTRLFEQISRTLEQTQALYRASRAINEADSLQGIAAGIATHVVRDPEASVSLISLALDANEVIRSARVEGAYLSRGDARQIQKAAFSDNSLPVLRKLKITHEPLILEDISQESRLTPREQRLFHLLGITSLMAVPIRMTDGWTGVILVSYPKPRTFKATELDRLVAIATQAATTMQNRELLIQTQESLLESRLLYQAGAGINEAETAEALLEALLPLADPINPDQVVLLLFDEPVLEGERPINFTAVAGLNRNQELIPLSQTFRVRDFPIFRRLPVTAPLVFEDIQASENVTEEEKQALRQLQIRSLLYLPLRIGTRYMGWIGFNASGARTVNESIVRRLQNIVQQAATALQSQQLFQEAQRRAWREEQISRITARLHSTTEPEEIMRIGLQELKRALNVKRAMAWMQPEEGSTKGYSGNGGPKGPNGRNGH